MKTKIIHTPDGVRDWLHDECAAKNKMVRKIENIFIRYGYQQIESPVFEFVEVFDTSLTNKSQNQLYHLANEKGDILALRADMTPPIVRIAATAYKNAEATLRFFYSGNVFSNTNTKHLQGKLRESYQTGVELLGVDCAEADAETIEIAIRALKAVGIQNFVIHISHAGFMKGILDACRFDEDMTGKVLEYIDNMDYTSIAKAIQNVELDKALKDVLENLPLLVGDPSMLLDYQQKIQNPLALAAIKRLIRIYDVLCDLHLQQHVAVDLGMVSHIHYYTGLVFRAYASGSGFPVASGGRYDNLAERFGKKMPAVGVTIKLNNVIDIVFKNNNKIKQENNKILIFYEDDCQRFNAVAFANQCREKGFIVENGFTSKPKEGEFITLFFMKDGQISCNNGYEGEKRTLSPNQLTHMLAEGSFLWKP